MAKELEYHRKRLVGLRVRSSLIITFREEVRFPVTLLQQKGNNEHSESGKVISVFVKIPVDLKSFICINVFVHFSVVPSTTVSQIVEFRT